MEKHFLTKTKKPSYRDELNFAEFPLAAISDRLPSDQKTLSFTDNIYDHGNGKPVKRTLTISASDEYGLPTALDDEVILGLIQLTNRSEFTTRKIYFTRYELIKLLGWRNESKSYSRISESLKRWLGVTLYYDKAWWSKEEQSWVSENFHILDQVTILDKERRERKIKVKKEDPNAGRSSFLWNEVVYDSFQAGYLKKIDLDFFRSLNSSISKRIYRFLDKRFYMKERLVFDIQEFAFEHIGLSRGYHNGEIKRRLKPAIKELEEKGFLHPLSASDRFQKQCRGKWTITLIRARKTPHKQDTVTIDSPVVSELTERGITLSTARTIAGTYPEALIREKMEFVDWLVSNKDPRISNNPAGYLYKAIEQNYALPKNFETKEQKRIKLEKQRKAAKARTEQERKQARKQAVIADTERELLDSFWNSLEPDAQEAFEKEALQFADKFLSEQYRKGRGDKGVLFRTVRQSIIDAHIRRKLQLKKVA